MVIVTLLIKTFFVLQEGWREGGRKKDDGNKKNTGWKRGRKLEEEWHGGKGYCCGIFLFVQLEEGREKGVVPRDDLESFQILVLGRRIDILLKALHSCWILNLLQCNLWAFWKKLSSGSTFYIAMGSEMPACWWSDLVVVTFDYGTDQQQNCFWLICTFFNNQGEWVLGELQTNMLQFSDFVFVFDRSTKSIRWRWDRILGLIGDGEHVVCWSFLFF